jgi:hypothetical protein
MKFLAFFCALFFAAMLPAQLNLEPPKLAPLVPAFAVELKGMPAVAASSIEADLSVLAVHENGLVSLSGLTDEGEFAVSFYGTKGAATAFATQGPMGSEPVPTLRTTWCDKDGVTHEVVTPIVSQTDAGLARAVALHDKLVAMQQAKHPPKPCPKP